MRTWQAMIVAALGLGLAGCQNNAPDWGADMSGPSRTLAALETMDPDARAVAQRVVAFVGGAAALDNVRTLEVRFEGQSDGNPLVFHLAWSRSGAAWYGMRMGPTEGRSGTQGDRYWREWEGQEVEMFEVDPDMEYGRNEMVDQVVDFASFPLTVINPTHSHFENRNPLESRGQGEFKSTQADVLSPKGEPDPGEPPLAQYYYDPQTGRPIGITQGPPSEPVYMAFSDWREVEGGKGLKMFHRVTVDGFWLGDAVFDLKAKFVRVNTLKEAGFAPPADAVLQQ
ncbi:MAG: hypothetical protein NCW75_08500 [Phycisphaera sp.]|nr:MAG: hypothetical protein NCW75_08500 [Phycisphaera sp.]